MRSSVQFVIGLSAIFGLLVYPALAQETAKQNPRHSDLRLSVVGVGAKDYAESLNFYTKVMGFRPAFSFSPNGKTMNTYLQVSRDTFLELQTAPPNAAPGLTHIHMQTDDADAVVARLRKAGVPACSAALKTGCTMDTRIARPTNEKSATIVDPSGIRIEPTQFIPGSLTRKAVDSWDNKYPSARLLVVGIGVKDYPESENFYGNLLGFPVAFKFTSPDGKRTTTYYQVSRDSFIEMQPVAAGAAPGLTHVHLLTEDLNAMIARLRKDGLASAPRNSTSPNTVTEPGLTQPSNVKSANVFDPNGIRLELNQLLPDSLTKKAMDAWK